jgi:hypothetical protein
MIAWWTVSEMVAAITYFPKLELGKQTTVHRTYDGLRAGTILVVVMPKVIEDLGTRHYWASR